eukprot:GHVL01043979.1.p1 GENE.GHVL01043979.1~~GHVL01043979.1.p1  ORF type:complete len:303 (+),score=85.45 GHVL01043979.1:959-1867(+)
MVNQELALYSDILAHKKQFIVVNKVDDPRVLERKETLEFQLKMSTRQANIPFISALTGENVYEVLNEIVKNMPQSSIQKSHNTYDLTRGGILIKDDTQIEDIYFENYKTDDKETDNNVTDDNKTDDNVTDGNETDDENLIYDDDIFMNTKELKERKMKKQMTVPLQDARVLELKSKNDEDEPPTMNVSDIHIEKKNNVFHMMGKTIADAVEMTHWGYPQSIRRFQKNIHFLGIGHALLNEGAVDGDIIQIKHLQFKLKIYHLKNENYKMDQSALDWLMNSKIKKKKEKYSSRLRRGRGGNHQ